jgi:hypothetical protein
VEKEDQCWKTAPLDLAAFSEQHDMSWMWVINRSSPIFVSGDERSSPSISDIGKQWAIYVVELASLFHWKDWDVSGFATEAMCWLSHGYRSLGFTYLILYENFYAHYFCFGKSPKSFNWQR